MGITINDVAARQSTVATSGQTEFTVPFRFFADTDLLVYVDDVLKTLSTDYTVTGAGLTAGMKVTFLVGVTLGSAVQITRAVPLANDFEFGTTGPFAVTTLNTILMRLVTMIQQVRDARPFALGSNDSDGSGSYDANSNRIRNVPDATETDEPVTLGQLNDTVIASGAGDVVGPAVATDGRVALFDGITGKLIKVGASLLSELATLASPAFTGTPTAP